MCVEILNLYVEMNIEQRLVQVLTDFETADKDIRKLLENNASKLLWKPSPKKWSAAQSIAHILVTNQSYFPILENKLAVQGNPLNNQKKYAPTFWGKMVYKAVDPTLMKTKKSVTFKIFNPKPVVEIAVLTTHFEKSQATLKKLIEKAMNTDASRKICSPLTPLVRFSVVDAMAIISKHEIRHYLQAKNVLELEGK